MICDCDWLQATEEHGDSEGKVLQINGLQIHADIGLKYFVSAFVATGFIYESWVTLCRNRLETQTIKSIFHCLKNDRKTQKETLNKILKMSFWFWAWLCIPLFHHTGVNRAAPLPQG